jgi:hypothetical protein
MRRLPAILVACAFALLGSGALSHVHAHAHAIEDRAAGRHACCSHPPDHGDRPLHDETNCDLHASLASPVLAPGYVPLLVCLGLFVAFLTQLDPSLPSQRTPARTDCRGPPAA